jgi:Ni/Co efflux regulator RcnB
MKSLKIAVVACSMFAAAAAYAQNDATAAGVPQQVAQSTGQPVAQASSHREMTPASQDPCVGPASFCNLYFGS